MFVKPCYIFLFSILATASFSLRAAEASTAHIHLKPDVIFKADLKDVLRETAVSGLCGLFIAGVSTLPIFIGAIPFLAKARSSIDIKIAGKLTFMCASLTACVGFLAFCRNRFELGLTQEEFNAKIDDIAKCMAHKRVAKECQDRSLLIKEAQCSADGTGQQVHIIVEPVNIHPTVNERQNAFAQACKYVESIPARFYGSCCSFAAITMTTYLYYTYNGC